MPWFTTQDVDDVVGRDVRQKICPDDRRFDVAEQKARISVRAAYQFAGYTLDDDNPTAMAKDIAVAYMIWERYGVEKGLDVPANILELVNRLEMVRRGTLPDPDATPDSRGGIGGVQAPPSSGTSGRPQRFSRSELEGL